MKKKQLQSWLIKTVKIKIKYKDRNNICNIFYTNYNFQKKKIAKKYLFQLKLNLQKVRTTSFIKNIKNYLNLYLSFFFSICFKILFKRMININTYNL